MPSSDMPEAPISRMQVVPLPQIKTRNYGETLAADRGKGIVYNGYSCSQESDLEAEVLEKSWQAEAVHKR